MTIAALLLVVAGALIVACALVPCPFDFAPSVRQGWHVTVLPPPPFVGVFAILIGIVTLAASLLRR